MLSPCQSICRGSLAVDVIVAVSVIHANHRGIVDQIVAYACMHLCMYVWVGVFMYVCVGRCIHVCMHFNIRIQCAMLEHISPRIAHTMQRKCFAHYVAHIPMI